MSSSLRYSFLWGSFIALIGGFWYQVDNIYPFYLVTDSFSRLHRLHPSHSSPVLSSAVAVVESPSWHLVGVFLVGDSYQRALLEKNKKYKLVSPGDKLSDHLEIVRMTPRSVIVRSLDHEHILSLETTKHS